MYGISYDKALYDCALECAARRSYKTCRQSWDSPACSSCKFYVKNYIHAEPNQVRLFMMQAESQVNWLKSGNQMRAIVLIIMAVLIIGLITTCSIMSVERHKQNMEWLRGTSTSLAPGVVSEMNKVNATLQITATTKRDINGDSLINYIDAAFIFDSVYPDKSAVRIEYNTKGTWSHLFNEVKTDGVWKAWNHRHVTQIKNLYG